MADAIRICCGTESKTYIAQKVLEHSIISRTKAKVEFTPLIGPQWEYPSDLKVGTGFSLRRWMIPAYFGWEGYAIYLDADQIVLGDIGDLTNTPVRHDGSPPVIGCTFQPDKFYKDPAPQTSVMLIACERARTFWGFHIDKVIEHLRANSTKEAYARFMHADWLAGRIQQIPTEWNHLNVHEPGKTKLLHYTSEPTQPFYKPDHPLAYLWRKELESALKAGFVTQDDLKAALAKWNVKEDWRNQNGLHPYYKRYLEKPVPSSPQKTNTGLRSPVTRKPEPTTAPSRKVLWVTSFAADMYGPSGQHLLRSFVETCSEGKFFVALEDCFPHDEFLKLSSFEFYNLGDDGFLRAWLKQNSGVIPAHLGGKHDGKCRCRGGPYEAHSKKHRMPCVGHWFNRNASRWFRKIAAIRAAREYATRTKSDYLVWLDADCFFKKTVTTPVVERWFRATHGPGIAAWYLRNKRPVLEAGCVGFNLRPGSGGSIVLSNIFDRYNSGRYRGDVRWDDAYQIQLSLSNSKTVDLARAVSKEHSEVVEHSELAEYLAHAKGSHSRKLNIMT